MKYAIMILTMFISVTASAQSFEQRHAKVINAIISAADLAEIPRELLLGVCWTESNYKNVGVTHLDGETVSHGICQVKLETAQFMDKLFRHKHPATTERLDNVKDNAFYAAKWLRYQLDRYNDNWKLAADAYNKGTAKSHKSEYVGKVFNSIEYVLKNVNKDLIYATRHAKALR